MNPITSLVTIVLAVIGALLFVSGLKIAGNHRSASSPCSCCSH